MTDPEKAISRLFSLLTLAKAATQEGTLAHERLQHVEIQAAVVYVADFAVSGFNLVVPDDQQIRPWPVTIPEVIGAHEKTFLNQMIAWAETGKPSERHFF